MKNRSSITLPLAATIATAACYATNTLAGSSCDEQATTIIERLQGEVTGALSASQRNDAKRIVLDACEQREHTVVAEQTQAVEQARKEEQEKASAWLTESADKEGNRRLKRKGH